MSRLLAKLKEKAPAIGLRLSLVLYKDQGDTYVSQLVKDFSTDLGSIDSAIQAVLDALETAIDRLTWRWSGKRSVVLIGDAPGHPTSARGTTTAAIVDAYKRAGLGIIVYPILVNK